MQLKNDKKKSHTMSKIKRQLKEIRIRERFEDAAGFENGGGDQGLQQLLGAGKGQETEPPSGPQPCNPLPLALGDSLLTSDVQNCKIVNLCCFKAHTHTLKGK